jgi:hypothetical protein
MSKEKLSAGESHLLTAAILQAKLDGEPDEVLRGLAALAQSPAEVRRVLGGNRKALVPPRLKDLFPVDRK